MNGEERDRRRENVRERERGRVRKARREIKIEGGRRRQEREGG